MIKNKKIYSIVVVEDNFNDCQKVEQLLLQMDFIPEITYAKNFQEASSIFSADDNFFDVVLLDPTLPDISAQKLLNEMLDKVLFCPIILLVSNTEVDFSIQSISQGVSDYLMKDVLTAAMLYKSIVCSIERKKIFFSYVGEKTRYTDFFHLSPSPMWVYNLETFYFLDINEAAIKKYGYKKEEFLKMTIREIRPEEDYPLFDEVIQSFSHYRDSSEKKHFRHEKKDGTIIDVEIKSNIIFYNNQKAKLVIANDVTKQMRHIITIKDQNQSLKDIAWTHSHVVRAPLAKMLSIVGFLKDSDRMSAEYEDLLNHFFDSATELDPIIRDIVKKTEIVNKTED